MASITMDIQARVVGYEQSLKTLQTALAKLDPGSDLGKSLTKALDQAKNQVAALSKNLFPKASSDTQVDAIIEKVNRAGEAVQHVAQLMQGLNTTDFNFSALGAGITDLQNKITSLESDMSSKLNNGLVSAIQNSKDLSELFAKLNIDLSQATTGSIFETLASQASKAQDEVSKAEAEVKKAQNAITNNAKSQQIQTAKIFGTEDSKNNIKQQVEEVQAQYDTAIGALKERITNGLSTLLQGTSGIDQTKLIDNFFKDLTPENIKDKINVLFTSLESSGLETTKRNFYEKLFGGGTNINQVIRNLNFEGLTEEYKNKLATIFEAIKNDLSAKDSNKITTLIGQNNIQSALENTLSSIEKAYERIQQKIKELQNKVIETLNPNLQAANLHYDNAIANQQAIDSANITLQGEINTLKSQLSDQAQEIAKLKEQLQAQTNSAVKQVKQSAGTAGTGAAAQMFPRSEAEAYKIELEQVAAKEQMLGKVQGVVQRWFSIYAAIRMVNNAIKSVISTVKELDTTITNIAIVTNMSQGDLWAQMPKYTAMARQYAASISGVYQVSQLYYQQGLQQNDVMALTEQTLKMARISGLDYAQATDYMTNAVRSFKMEMTDASTVVDVYSAIAASSATSVSELASAMSKTASSAQAVGSSFENTTAMMAVMIEATRESAENIGSALKSIISRYGEMKADPSKLVDSEGQEMSLNKVDKALQTVGISIKDVNGEFRNFDDVIMELAKNWDTIDKNTQRYIATVMAGNRQQSRFLALVSSYDRLKELSEEAADSENASQLQYLKTLDSIDAKTQQLQTSIQSLYTSSGIETSYKGLLDWANNLVKTLDQLEEKSGLATVVGKIGAAFTTLATLVTTIFTRIKAHYSNMKTSMLNTAKRDAALEQQRIANEELETIESEYRKTGVVEEQAYERAKAKKREADQAVDAIAQEERAYMKLQNKMSKQSKLSTAGMVASSLGMVGTTLAASIDLTKNPEKRGLKAATTGISAGLSGLGTGLMVGATAGGPVGALIGGLTALPGIIEAIGMGSESAAEKIATLENNIKEASNASIQSKSELKTLEEYKTKYDELSKSQYESAEKKQEFINLQNEIAATYPELISYMTEEGNYVINMAESYETLAKAKRNAYRTDLLSQMSSELTGLNNLDYVLKNIYGHENVQNGKRGLLGSSSDRIEDLMKLDYSQGIPTNGIKDIFSSKMGISTANAIFNNKVPIDLFDNISETGQPSFEWQDEGLDEIVSMYEYFVESARYGKDLVSAQTELIQHYKNSGILTDEYENFINSFRGDVYEELQLRASVPKDTTKLIHNRLNTSMTEYVNLIADSADSIFDTDSSNIDKRFAKEKLMTEWDKFYEENKSKVEDEKINWDTGETYTYGDLINEFYKKYEEFWYNKTTENIDFTDEQNEFYNNLGQHTISEVKKMFPEVSQEEMDTMSGKDRILAEAQNERTAFIRKVYGLNKNWELDVETNSDIGKILKNYSDWLNSEEVSKFNISNYGDKIGPEFLGKIQELYQTIINNSSLGEKQIQSQINALNNINNYITSDAFTSDQRNTLLGKIASADLTSVYGIYDLIETINSLELDDANKNNLIVSLKQLSNALSANIQGEIDSYIDTIEKNSTDFTKAVSSATGGMDIKTATEMAAKLGVTLNDFEVIGGKFYFNDLEKLRQAYLKENQEYEQALRDNVEKRYSDFEKITQIKIIDNEGEENDIFEELSGTKILNGEYSVKDLQDILKSDAAQVDFQQITGVSYTDFIEYYTEFQKQIETGTSDFVEFMLLKVDSYLDESGKNLMAYLQQNAATNLFKAGDTEGFMKSIGVYKPENIEDYTLSAEELAQAKVEAQAQVDEAIDSNQKNIQDKVETYREQAVEALRGVSQADVDTKASELLHTDVDKNNAILDSQEKIKELSEYQLDAIQEFLDNGLVSEEDLQKEIERLEADYDTRLAKAGYQEIDDEKIQTQAEQDYLADFEERKKKYYEARKQWGYTPEAADEQFGAYEDTEEYKQQWIQERTNALVNEIEMANEAIINSFEDSDIVTKDQALENLGAIGTYSAAEVDTRAQELLDDAIARNNAKLKELIKTGSKDYTTLAIKALNGNADYTEEELQAKMEELAKQDLIDSGEWLSEELESYQPKAISEEEAAAQAEEAVKRNQRIENAINTANIEELTAIDKEFGTDLMSFSKLIYDQYHNVRSSIVNTMTNAVGGKTKYFEVTDVNKEQLEELQQLHPDWITGEVKVGQYVTISAEQLALDADAYMQYIATSFDTVDEQIKALSEYHKNKYANNSTSSLSSIIEKATFSYNDLLNYLVNNHNVDLKSLDESTLQTYMNSMGLAFNSVGEVIVENYEKWTADLQWAVDNLSDDASITEINAAKARLAEAQTQQVANQKSAISDIVGNYNAVTEKQKETLANSLNINIDGLAQYFTSNGDGTSILDVTKFKQNIKDGTLKVENGVVELLNEVFAGAADNYIKNIQTATSLITKGTVNQKDIESFKTLYQEIMQKDLSVDAFQYNDILDTWTLDPTILKEYVEAQAQELVNAGLLAQDEVASYLDTNVRQVLASSIDIGSFLDAENKGQNSEAYKTLKNSFVTYIKSSDELLSRLTDGYINSVAGNASDSIKQDIRKSMGTNAPEIIANHYISLIKRGGADAVEVMKAVAEAQGVELSASDIEAAYRSEVSEVENALDQLSYSTGAIISGAAVDILDAANYGIHRIEGTNSAVITSIGDVADAYVAYYNALEASGEATLGALNEAYAKVLETKDGRGKQQSAIDALGNALGMTYTEFAEIFTEAGIKLTDDIMNQLSTDNIIEAMGGNKMRILDFTKFAQAMHWDTSSEEYLSAFKSYNDGLIELNRKAEKDIAEEITSLKDAKAGDWINLTTLYTKLNQAIKTSMYDDRGFKLNTPRIIENPLKDLQEELLLYGGTLKDGILQLSDNANLLEIARSIRDASKEAELDLQDGFDEIEDAIEDIFKSYVEAIQKGIKGGLNNSDKADLITKAQDLGINNLQFEKTAEGLKLSEQSAIALYQALKKVDALQASLVFDDLRESLEATNDNFKDTTALLTHVNKIRNGTYAADDKVSQARLKQYEAELSVAEEILAVRASSEDSSFNFMDNKIPAGQNNPLNYMENWAQAYEKMKATQKGGKDQRGLMAYEDFYNIVTEMGRIAELSKQPIKLGKETLENSQQAADLITQAAGALKVTSDGKMKVDLSKIGVDFQTGAEQMSKDINAGIDAVADSQISMLDALIQMLEVIVAMEQLGDIDVNGDNTLNIDEIFDVEGIEDAKNNLDKVENFSKQFNETRKKLIAYLDEKGNEEVKAAFENTRLNFGAGWKNMYELLNDDFSETFGKLTGEDKSKAMKSFQGLLNSFYQAAISGDYDLDNIASSVKDILERSGVALEDFIMNFTEGEGKNKKITRTLTFMGETLINIDFKDDDKRKEINKLLKENYRNADEYQKAVQEALEGLKGNDPEIKQEKKFKFRTLIGLASNEFILDDEPDKDGNFSGNYDGQKFKGGSKDAILNQMAEAALYKDFGGDFVLETDKETGITTSVKGKATVGGTEVDLIIDENGNVLYNYKGHQYTKDQLSELKGDLAAHGELDEIGDYIFKDGDNEYQITVRMDDRLELTYSHYIDAEGKDHYVYNGRDFNNYDAMFEYMRLQKKYGDKGKLEHKDVYKFGKKTGDHDIIKINDYASIDYTTTVDEVIGPKFLIDNQEVPENAFDAYLEAYSKNDFQDLEYDASGRKHVQYRSSGRKIDVYIDLTTGETEYTYEGSDGVSFSATSEADLLALVAAYYNELPDDVPDVNGRSVTLEIQKGVKAKFVYNPESGSWEFDSESKAAIASAGGDALEKAQETLDRLNASSAPQELEQPVEAAVSTVKLSLAPGASVGLDGTVALTTPIDKASGTVKTLVITAENTEAEGTITNAEIQAKLDGVKVDVNIDKKTAEKDLEEIKTKTNEVDALTPEISVTADDQASSKIASVATAIANLVNNGPYTFTINGEISTSGSPEGEGGEATGNVGLAKAAGTLMGELGPELVVSNGRYFVVGQHGPEMVNLADDAIVFNHLQTESLLNKGTSSTRGRAITNEYNATAYAGGKDDSNIQITVSNDGESDKITNGILNALPTMMDELRIVISEASPAININYPNDDNKTKINDIKISSPPPKDQNTQRLANAKGTLMGELGPELVVSNGHYFVAGQNGAEFVDLADDAIVFNHKQTEELLSKGNISSHGTPKTSAEKAIAFARGHMNGGPAMASAAAALAALKQLRAMWQSLKGATAKDLAGLGGSGGGGGGGKEEKAAEDKAFIRDLEKWYNWLQKIAQLEIEINYQESLRNKITSDFNKNGRAYFQSQTETLKDLKEELAVTKDLAAAQQAYFNKRRSALNKQSAFSSLYTFDENGQLVYNSTKKTYKGLKKKGNKKLSGFEFLSELNRRDSVTGQAAYTAKEQVDILKANGFGKYLNYDSSGNKIDTSQEGWETSALEAFWDKIDADQQEMQSLHDSVNEYYDQLLELQQKSNELLKEMQDNQLEVEDAVLKAIEETAQRNIDELQDLRDAYSDSASKLIDGLSDQLNKEREKYNRSENEQDLLKLRRRLALLQRTGGSASEIASLESEIRSKSQEAYFDKQQEQIDNLQEASDAQLERLDKQIDILTETLEYQKKYGLLWGQVYEVMAKSPEEIASYIQQNTEDYWNKSPLGSIQAANDWLFKTEQWSSFRDEMANPESETYKQFMQFMDKEEARKAAVERYQTGIVEAYGDNYDKLSDEEKQNAERAFIENYDATGDERTAMTAAQQVVQGSLDWQAKQASYKKTYGNSWTALDAESRSKLEEAVRSGDAAKIQAVQNELKNNGLYTEAQRKKKQFKLIQKDDGTYEIQKVKEGSKGATTYDKAYTQMFNKDWKQFTSTQDSAWKALTSDQLNKLKKVFKTAYDNAFMEDKYAAAEQALLASKAYKTYILDAKDKAIWAVKQDSKTKQWSVVKKRNTTKTPTTYDEAFAVAQANNQLYSDYLTAMNDPNVDPKPSAPVYNTKYKYDIGGIVDETGPALLHAREAVLNSHQTDVLRNEILGNNKDSLLNLLVDFKKAYSNSNIGIAAQSPIIIQNASVNMNVEKLASDYDARRAGEQALAEMMRIARKTGATNSIRR